MSPALNASWPRLTRAAFSSDPRLWRGNVKVQGCGSGVRRLSQCLRPRLEDQVVAAGRLALEAFPVPTQGGLPGQVFRAAFHGSVVVSGGVAPMMTFVVDLPIELRIACNIDPRLGSWPAHGGAQRGHTPRRRSNAKQGCSKGQ